MSFIYQHDSYYICFFFFFNDTATTEIYTLSLHDALPISTGQDERTNGLLLGRIRKWRLEEYKKWDDDLAASVFARSEEHTSELQSRRDLVCRLLLEKKKKKIKRNNI